MSSRRSYRYRKLADNSQVDETLFGKPQPLDKRGNPAPRAPKKQPQKKQEGETIQIITKDLIRTLRIPVKDASREPIILPLAEFEQMKLESKVLTEEEREAQRKAYQREKEEKISAAEEMKQQMYEIDLSRKKNKALTELELEARDREQNLVDHANALRMEEEEEIQQFDRLIRDVQCQAALDAQIFEKKQIQAKFLEEEKRLDAMMEVERRKGLEIAEQIDELRKQQRIRGMQQISDQIQQHLEEKQIEDEMKEREKQQTREKQDKMNLEDLKALEKKREEQHRLREKFMHINTENMRAKEQRREEEKLADLRDMEYRQKKMEREAEYEAEQRRVKKEKDLALASAWAHTKKAKDFKAEQDELRARRIQEAKEREWRRKEKELCEKKVQEKEMLMAALTEQIHCKEHQLSIEAGRKKAEFERVLKVQQEEIIKQKEEEEKQHQKAQRQTEALQTQVKEHVISAVAKRRKIFKGAERLMEEAQLRHVRLDKIKEKKLKELRATGLPEKYCSKVERKAWK